VAQAAGPLVRGPLARAKETSRNCGSGSRRSAMSGITRCGRHRRDIGMSRHKCDGPLARARANRRRRCQAGRAGEAYSSLCAEKARVAFVPPKPNEFESACAIFFSRAVFGT
jgi:hypothetical protein